MMTTIISNPAIVGPIGIALIIGSAYLHSFGVPAGIKKAPKRLLHALIALF